jgi:hypothetical protein
MSKIEPLEVLRTRAASRAFEALEHCLTIERGQVIINPQRANGILRRCFDRGYDAGILHRPEKTGTNDVSKD